jgi:hypothetical protein
VRQNIGGGFLLELDTDSMMDQINDLIAGIGMIGGEDLTLANALNETMLVLRAELVQNANETYRTRGKKIKKTDLKIKRATARKPLNAMITAKGYKKGLSQFDYEPFEVISNGKDTPGGYTVRVRADSALRALSGTARHSKGFLVEFESGHRAIVQRARSKSVEYKSKAGLYKRKSRGQDTRRITELYAPALSQLISARDVYYPAEEVFGESVQEVLQKNIGEALKQATGRG